MTAKNYILRSVYLEPALDAFLRHQAFTQKISKNDLIRRYVTLGASVELGEDVLGLMKNHPRPDVRKITADIKDAAYGANLAPLRITATGSAVVRTSAGGTVLITSVDEAKTIAAASATPVIAGHGASMKKSAKKAPAVKNGTARRASAKKVVAEKAASKATVLGKTARAAKKAVPGKKAVTKEVARPTSVGKKRSERAPARTSVRKAPRKSAT